MRLFESAAGPDYCAFVHDRVAGAEILHVFGEIDIPADALFDRAIERAMRPERDLIIDLDGCTYMGAAGLSVLIRARTSSGDRLRLAVPGQGFIARLLTIAEMDRSFTISDSLEGALSSLDVSRRCAGERFAL